MVKPFEKLNVDVSCLGNHELDHGIENAMKLMAKTECPWLMTNLIDKITGDPICGCKAYHIADYQGFKFGFLGFAEQEWTDTFSAQVDISNMQYIDYNESLQKYSKILRDQGCDFIVAINHVRLPNDQNMAAKNDDKVVDLIFGGHDHGYARELNEETGVFIQKSGTDFECFTNLTILLDVE